MFSELPSEELPGMLSFLFLKRDNTCNSHEYAGSLTVSSGEKDTL